MPAGRLYILPIFFFYIFQFLVVDLGATSYLTDLHQIFRVGNLVHGFVNFALIWRSLKGRCHGNNLRRKTGVLADELSLMLNAGAAMDRLEAH